ncbi:class II aldolase/adducin family protein [soil metagenome]
MNDMTLREISSQFSEQEYALRKDLAAAYRLAAHFGMADMVYTHFSVRLPGPEPVFLINPYGMMFEEITASSLIKVGIDGEVIGDSEWPHNPAGFTIHSAVHMSGDDRHCVFHCHSVNAMAVAALKCGLLPISQFSIPYYNRVSYHDYEGPSLNLEERGRLLQNLGNNRSMILRSHGLLTVGKTIPEAFILLYYLEKSCEIQIKAQSTNTEIIVPSAEVNEYSAQLRYSEAQHTGAPGAIEWQALLRKLDRMDDSYRL